ncbi:MAG: hypothetical protein IT225_01435 [Flavobacteriales bacterium]|jgi:hypothetical protein|nr:hypothetical protein [Flavobacteriales bacterium]
MNTQQDIKANEIEALGSETLKAIYQGQTDKVVQLYGKVELLLKNGSDLSRSLIATKFVLPISRLLEMNYSWGKEYLKLFPELLRMEHYRQVNATGL